jgi:hypothetical protein
VLPLPPGVVLVPLLEEPDVPLLEEPEPAGGVELRRLESGDADGEPVSLRLHAVTPTAITSAKNTERALVISHLH